MIKYHTKTHSQRSKFFAPSMYMLQNSHSKRITFDMCKDHTIPKGQWTLERLLNFDLRYDAKFGS